MSEYLKKLHEVYTNARAEGFDILADAIAEMIRQEMPR